MDNNLDSMEEIWDHAHVIKDSGNRPFFETEPIIEEWILRTLSRQQWDMLGREPLVAIPIAESKSDEEISDDVLAAWQRTVASRQRHVDQVELSLLERMRRQGKTWREVASLLGLRDETAAEQHYAQLSARLKTPPFSAPHPASATNSE